MRNSIKILILSVALAQGFAIALPAQQVQPKCICPQFQVVSNYAVVKAGEIVEFSVHTNDPIPSAKFEWEVSKGAIVSGQGTEKIAVQTSEEMLKPAPTPTSLPPPGEHGFLLSVLRRPSVSIAATARFVGDGSCACAGAAGTVKVGTRSVLLNRFADVTRVTLSANELVAPCDPGQRPAEGVRVSDSMIVDVDVSALDPENDVLTYSYTVSGGRVIGTGSKVKWDLTGANAGRYTITVGVDDGCGICGKTWTEKVTVVECEPMCALIECPTIEVIGPPGLLGDESTFTANVLGGAQQSVTYSWSILNGEILRGQGTPSITVKTASEATGSVTVRIGGLDPRGSCIDSVTKEFEDGRLKP